MRPKEKVKEKVIELFDKMWLEGLSTGYADLSKKSAEQCVLICVDEICHIKMKYGRFEGYKDYWNYYSFWEDVKQEIEKL